MIASADYARLMARYNAWQNDSLLDAAATLSPAARAAERGAFFGSIMGTLSHLLWADLAWMARFDGGAAPRDGIRQSAAMVTDWTAYRSERAATDLRIRDWAASLDDSALARDLSFHSGALGREVTRPMDLCVAHFFNHQTHHRGQVHAMLTAAGAAPGDTDLFVMPEETRP